MTPRHLPVCWDPLREKNHLQPKVSFFYHLDQNEKNMVACHHTQISLKAKVVFIPFAHHQRNHETTSFLVSLDSSLQTGGMEKKTLPVLGAAILQQGFQVLGILICFLRFFQVPLMFLTGGTIRFNRGRVERLVAFWWITAGFCQDESFWYRILCSTLWQLSLCKHSRFSFGAGVVVLRWALVRCLMAVLAVVWKQLPRRMDPNHCYAQSFWDCFFSTPYCWWTKSD